MELAIDSSTKDTAASMALWYASQTSFNACFIALTWVKSEFSESDHMLRLSTFFIFFPFIATERLIREPT